MSTTPVVDVGAILSSMVEGLVTLLQAFVDTLVTYAPILAQVLVAGVIIYGIVRYGRRIVRTLTGMLGGFFI